MEHYDVVILGSGLGGLIAANILSKNNYSVCVVEKNEQFGGALQIYKRDNVMLDTGVHYIGGLGKGENLYQFFKYLGLIDKLTLKQLDKDGFDRISFSENEEIYPWANGYENFEKTLTNIFPNEKTGIQAYVKMVKETCESIELYNLKTPDAPSFQAAYYSLNTYDFLKSIITDEKLIAVLLGNNLLYYADKDKTPFYVHALIVNSYILSAWRCIDGGQQIASILVRSIRGNGGKVLRLQEVVKIETENGLATTVQLKSGKQIFGKNFISNINPSLTLDLLDEKVLRSAYKKRIKSIENAMSAYTMHIILKENTFPYFNYNRYHFTTNNLWCNSRYEVENWPENLMIFTPAFGEHDTYAKSISIMCSMSFDEVKEWETSHSTVPEKNIRDENYLVWKAAKEQKVLDIVYTLYPSLKGNISAVHSASPLTYRDYLNTKEGSTYGSIKNCQHPLESYLSPRTKIANLYLTGQDINLHGILGVTISAFLTCASFVDMDQLMKEVREA